MVVQLLNRYPRFSCPLQFSSLAIDSSFNLCSLVSINKKFDCSSDQLYLNAILSTQLVLFSQFNLPLNLIKDRQLWILRRFNHKVISSSQLATTTVVLAFLKVSLQEIYLRIIQVDILYLLIMLNIKVICIAEKCLLSFVNNT